MTKQKRNRLIVILSFVIPMAVACWAAVLVPYGWDLGTGIIIFVGALFSAGLALGVNAALQEDSFRDGYLDVLSLLGVGTVALFSVILEIFGIVLSVELISGLFRRRRS